MASAVPGPAYGLADSRVTSHLPARRANRSTVQTTIAAIRITEVVIRMSGKCPGSESKADHIFSGCSRGSQEFDVVDPAEKHSDSGAEGSSDVNREKRSPPSRRPHVVAQ